MISSLCQQSAEEFASALSFSGCPCRIGSVRTGCHGTGHARKKLGTPEIPTEPLILTFWHAKSYGVDGRYLRYLKSVDAEAAEDGSFEKMPRVPKSLVFSSKCGQESAFYRSLAVDTPD
jgi:hypothetical protein